MPYKDLEKRKEKDAEYKRAKREREKSSPNYLSIMANRAKSALERYNQHKDDADFRAKRNELAKMSYPAQKSKKMAYHYQRTFGISLEEYNAMFDAQEGCCAICGRHQSEFKRSLAVDHDHETGEVRALLCSHCNTALGHFQDSLEVLDAAREYLSFYK